MKWSRFGRAAMALTSAVALGLSMTACGGGTIAYLWAVGTQYNQIAGYMVDDFTGNLTAMPNQPYSTSGTNPVDILVRPGGGRFVYVVNQGSGFTNNSNGTGEGIALFAVGGEGTLTFEHSYETKGYGHLWATFDTTGSYLFVLDQYSPSGDGNGAITIFSSEPTNGRLSFYGQPGFTQPGQQAPTYLEVGKSPLRMFSTGGCLFTANSANQSISAYSIGNGQLGTVTTGTFNPGTTHMTSINGNGQYVFLTDDQGGGKPGIIFSFTVASGCSRTAFGGGQKLNNATVANPVNTLLSTSGRYVYVLNSSATNTSTTTKGSSITAYDLTTGVLTELSNSPFGSGSGPVCAVEDPTSKYLYVANNTDGTITGYQYSDTSGQIFGLQRGSSFTTSTKGLTCLAISGSI